MELEKCPEKLKDRRVVTIQKQKDSHANLKIKIKEVN